MRVPSGAWFAVLLLSAGACQSPVRDPPTLEAAAVHALGALPWDHAATLGPVLCPTLGPCDTIWLEPRITQLPNPAPAFFVPDARPSVRQLEDTPAAQLPGVARLRRPIRYGAWTECVARRHDAEWLTMRRACVAVGLAGDRRQTDTLLFALLVLTPAEGLKWPRVRVVHDARNGWRGALVSMGGE